MSQQALAATHVIIWCTLLLFRYEVCMVIAFTQQGCDHASSAWRSLFPSPPIRNLTALQTKQLDRQRETAGPERSSHRSTVLVLLIDCASNQIRGRGWSMLRVSEWRRTVVLVSLPIASSRGNKLVSNRMVQTGAPSNALLSPIADNTSPCPNQSL